MARTFEIEINPEIIKWARESAGWSIDEIAKKLKTSKENYQDIESGKKRPTFKQLEILAQCFKRPLATFFLPEPPAEPSIVSSFRVLPKSESEISKDLRLAIRKARYFQSISNELMRDLGIKYKGEVKIATLQDDPKKIAQEERKSMNISLEQQFKWQSPYQAFQIWRNAVESKNILVFQFKFPLYDARGFSLTDKDPPVIVINSSDNILARIFTLFHEYAHIILGESEIYTEQIIQNKNMENWCNIFTSEFLIPEKALEEDEDFLHFIQTKNLSEILQKLSNKFKVSRKAILVRLKTLNLIDEEDYKRESEALDQISTSQKGKYLMPPKKCLQEKGRRFIYLILESKERGIVTTQDVVEYLSIKLKHLVKLQELVAE